MNIAKGAPYMPARPYQRNLFFGRQAEIDSLVQTLMDPLAGEKRLRAPMVEGGASIGKTWLLKRVEDELEHHPVVILFIHSNDVPANHDLLVQRLLHDLWLKGMERIPSLAPPGVGPNDTKAEKDQKVAQYVQEDPVNLFRDFTERLGSAEPSHWLVLIVDGIDEFEEPILHVLEDYFIEPLFAYPCVRLLSSRRVRSATHRWVRFTIKQQLPPEPMVLQPFDAPAIQVARLFAGTPYTFAQIQALAPRYSWQNPGANDFLVERFKGNGGVLNRGDFVDCLRELMRSARTGGQALDATYFHYLEQLIASPLNLTGLTGVARYEIKRVLGGVADSEINAFLAHLQERGIGYPSSWATFRIYTHIVELFRQATV